MDYCILKLKYHQKNCIDFLCDSYICVPFKFGVVPVHIALQVKSGNELDTSIQCT